MLCRARGAFQHAADFLNAHALVVPQDEGRPFGGAQIVHCLLNAFANFAAQRHAVRRGVGGWQRQREIDRFAIRIGGLMFRPPFARAHQVERAVRGDAVKPGAETGPLIEPRELPVGAEKAFLHHVFGVLLIASHTISQPEQRTAMALHQHSERVGIPGTRPGDERCVG